MRKTELHTEHEGADIVRDLVHSAGVMLAGSLAGGAPFSVGVAHFFAATPGGYHAQRCFRSLAVASFSAGQAAGLQTLLSWFSRRAHYPEGFSRTTSRGSLSSRNPKKAGWRR